MMPFVRSFKLHILQRLLSLKRHSSIHLHQFVVFLFKLFFMSCYCCCFCLNQLFNVYDTSSRFHIRGVFFLFRFVSLMCQ